MTTYAARPTGAAFGYGQIVETYLTGLMIQYMDMWQQHVYTKVKLLRHLMTKLGVIAGKQSLGYVEDALPQSAGIGGFELGLMPNAGATSGFNPVTSPKNIYTTLEWSGEVQRLARAGKPYSFVPPRVRDLKNARAQMDMNMVQMAMLGPAHILGKISAYDAGTRVATLFGRNTRTSAAADFFKNGDHYARKNRLVQFASTLLGSPTYESAASSTGQVGSAREIKISARGHANVDAPTITLDAAPNVQPAAGDYVIPYASRRHVVTTSGGLPNMTDFAGISGLAEMIGDANLYGGLYELDRASYETLSGIRLTKGGNPQPFSEHYLMLAVDRIADEGRGEEPNLIYSDRSLRREWVRLTAPERRFAPIFTGGGFKGDRKLQYTAGDAELPWETDRDSLPGMAWIMNTEDFGSLENSPLGPVDDFTSARWVERTDAKRIHLHMSLQLICEAPFNNGTYEDNQYKVNELS